MRRPIPLSQRRLDWILLAFFALNLFFITYIVDIEQLTIANPFHFQYPLWPPRFFVDMVHSYGSRYDPLLMARPAFWRMGIWIDVIWNGPFYVFAIYAIVRGRDWIRVPALVWCGSMSAVVLMILSEEFNGIHRAPHFGFVLALNLPWLLLPLGTLARMARAHPFTELVPAQAAPVTQAESAAEGLGPTPGGIRRPGAPRDPGNPAVRGRPGPGRTRAAVTRRPFAQYYGPWALVAGGSEGLGAAFADEIARRGVNLILVARRSEQLERAAARLRARARRRGHHRRGRPEPTKRPSTRCQRPPRESRSAWWWRMPRSPRPGRSCTPPRRRSPARSNSTAGPARCSRTVSCRPWSAAVAAA